VSGPRDEHADLRRAFQDLVEDSAAEGVDLERVWRAVSGEAPPEERRAVVLKMAEDPSWALAWRLGHELVEAAHESARPKVLRPRWGAPLRYGALAAALGGAAAIGLYMRPDPPGYRESEGPRIESLVPDDSVLPRTRFVLRWRPLAGARYALRVTSEDLVRAHTAPGLEEAHHQVPEGFLADLPAGSRVLWQVDARLPDGSVVSSETFAVRLE
jgi:hypothetical protein